MKRLAIILAFVMGCSFSALAENDSYTIDDNAIEQVFAQASEVSLESADLFALTPAPMQATEGNASSATLASANPWAAWAICWVVGYFGIHRHYMGTKPSMWAIYTFTCGGIFGVVTMVDWVVLLVGAIQDNISPYTNNDSFFMWL